MASVFQALFLTAAPSSSPSSPCAGMFHSVPLCFAWKVRWYHIIPAFHCTQQPNDGTYIGWSVTVIHPLFTAGLYRMLIDTLSENLFSLGLRSSSCALKHQELVLNSPTTVFRVWSNSWVFRLKCIHFLQCCVINQGKCYFRKQRLSQKLLIWISDALFNFDGLETMLSPLLQPDGSSL